MSRSSASASKNPDPRPGGWRLTLLRTLALLVVIGITVGAFLIRDRIAGLEAYGYAGIAAIVFLAYATVLIPAPGIAVVFAMGASLNPVGVALAAATGGALGELTGYLAGFSGQAVIERTKWFNRVYPWIQRYGPWAVMGLATIPNPVFDVVGLAAGVLKMPLWKFLLFCWFGQLIKMLAVAYAGSLSLTWLFG